MKCKNCGFEIPENIFKCPKCNETVKYGSITTGNTGNALDKAVSQSIAKLKTKELLTKVESVDNFSEQQNDFVQLTLKDLDKVTGQLDNSQDAIFRDIEDVLSIKDTNLEIGGIQLSKLLGKNESDIKTIKKGLVFLKHKKYDLAVEWWTINRQRLDDSKQTSKFLLLIMEAYTHDLSGNSNMLEKTQEKIQSHPLFSKFNQV